MMPPFVVFPTNRIAHFVEVSLYLFYLAQQVKLICEFTKEQRNAQKCVSLLFSVFYKNHTKSMRKLLNIYRILIDVQNSGWYNRAYRMTKSQFIFIVRDMILQMDGNFFREIKTVTIHIREKIESEC